MGLQMRTDIIYTSIMTEDHPRTTARRKALARGLLAGPVCFATAVLVMAAGAIWVPKGAAGINNIALPVVFFPVIWALLFFYVMLDRRLARAWGLTVALLVSHGGLVAQHLLAIEAAPGAERPAESTNGTTP